MAVYLDMLNCVSGVLIPRSVNAEYKYFFFPPFLQNFRILKLTLFWWIFFNIYDLQKVWAATRESQGVGESWKPHTLQPRPTPPLRVLNSKIMFYLEQILRKWNPKSAKTHIKKMWNCFRTNKVKLNISLRSAILRYSWEIILKKSILRWSLFDLGLSESHYFIVSTELESQRTSAVIFGDHSLVYIQSWYLNNATWSHHDDVVNSFKSSLK